LTERRASFVRTDKTAPDYTLHALPGDIARPGMVRTEEGKGAAISLELWDMPVGAFGSFMKTIPAPLGIGTLTLADGSTAQGFLCEAIAASGSEDITELADWRKYLAKQA